MRRKPDAWGRLFAAWWGRTADLQNRSAPRLLPANPYPTANRLHGTANATDSNDSNSC